MATDEFWMDSRVNSTIAGNVPASSSIILIAGLDYDVVVEGNHSVWGSQNLSGLQIPIKYPSPGYGAHDSGMDAEWKYASDSGDPGVTHFEGIWLSLDGGLTSFHPEPLASPTDVTNTYRYRVTGQGQPLYAYVNDTPLTDNNGMYRITVEGGITAHHGRRAFKFTAQEDTSEVVTGTGVVTTDTPVMESNDPNAVLTQPSTPVWSDNDDATYTEHLRLSSDPYNAAHSRADTGKATLDPAPADATFIRMRVRASIPSTDETPGTVALSLVAYQTVDPWEEWYLADATGTTLEIPGDGLVYEMVATSVTKYWTGSPDVNGFMAAVKAGTCEMQITNWAAEETGEYTTTMRVHEVALDYQLQNTLIVPAPRAVMVAEGPDEASEGPGWSNHRGMFKIPSVRTISGQFQVRCEGEDIWAMPYARFFYWDGTQMLLQDEVQASHPKKIMSGADWTEFTFHRDAYDSASHWMLAIQFSVEDPRFSLGDWPAPPDPSTAVYVDCVYVPENGLSLVEWEQDYLDGDQPGAYWEGRDQMSTSTKGEKPPDNLSEIILVDDELVIP